jgi:hypothetical protein
MLEPDEGKLSRPVLRRGAGSNPGPLAGGVALHQIAPGVADALDDELDSTSMPAGPDQHDNVSAEDAEPGPG